MVIKIAFGHQARVGKDTACEYLAHKYGGSILHFSDALYNILYYAQDQCNIPRCKDRKFLQWVGTDWGRAINDNIWIDIVINKIQHLNSSQNIFVGDVRFPNELAALKREGFKCIKIINPRIESSSHESETALANSTDWDNIILNNGTLEEFYEKLNNI